MSINEVEEVIKKTIDPFGSIIKDVLNLGEVKEITKSNVETDDNVESIG